MQTTIACHTRCPTWHIAPALLQRWVHASSAARWSAPIPMLLGHTRAAQLLATVTAAAMMMANMGSLLGQESMRAVQQQEGRASGPCWDPVLP